VGWASYHEGDGDRFGDLKDAADHDDAIFERPELGLANALEDVRVKNGSPEAIDMHGLDQTLGLVSHLPSVLPERLTKISQAQRSIVHKS
jgi:hypothetical protein